MIKKSLKEQLQTKKTHSLTYSLAKQKFLIFINFNLPNFLLWIRLLVLSLGILYLLSQLRDFILFLEKVFIVLHLSPSYILSTFLHNVWDIVHGSFLWGSGQWVFNYTTSFFWKMFSFFIWVVFARCIKMSTRHIPVSVFWILYSILFIDRINLLIPLIT